MASHTVWFTRKNLPVELRDMRVWPAVDTSLLEESQRAEIVRRQRAVTAYLNNLPVDAIWRDCRIRRHVLLRLLNRCLAIHSDGRIHGWRALVPNFHIEPTRAGHPRLRAVAFQVPLRNFCKSIQRFNRPWIG
jgi:putative transposase